MSSVTVDRLDKLIQRVDYLTRGLLGDVPQNLIKETKITHTQIKLDKASAFALGADIRKVSNCNLILISTDGTINDVSFKIQGLDGQFGPELEASLIDYWIGGALRIDVANDTAEAGKSIYIDVYMAPLSLLGVVKRSFVSGTIVARTSAFYASKVDYDGTANFFETDQPLGTTPTLSMTTLPATAKYARIDSVKYQMTPTNVVTYELYLLEDAQADDQRSESDVFFDSGAAQASGSVYINTGGGSTPKLPIVVNLGTVATIYYMIDWSAAPGDTTGYIKISGEMFT